jgi:hypothetical protein
VRLDVVLELVDTVEVTVDGSSPCRKVVVPGDAELEFAVGSRAMVVDADYNGKGIVEVECEESGDSSARRVERTEPSDADLGSVGVVRVGKSRDRIPALIDA